MGGERAEIQFQIRDIGEAYHCFSPEGADIFAHLHHPFLTREVTYVLLFLLLLLLVLLRLGLYSHLYRRWL
jgi:hypothetical protein